MLLLSSEMLLMLSCVKETTDEGWDSCMMVGACLFNCANHVPGVYNTLTKGYNICDQWNRAGALCGRCLPNHYALAYSFNLTCIRCPQAGRNWVRYIMAAYLPLTLFYIIIFFFSVSITNSQYFSVVMYA